MRIAVNTRFLFPHKLEGFGWFTHEVVSRMVKNHPEHQFYFFFDRPYDDKFVRIWITFKYVSGKQNKLLI